MNDRLNGNAEHHEQRQQLLVRSSRELELTQARFQIDQEGIGCTTIAIESCSEHEIVQCSFPHAPAQGSRFGAEQAEKLMESGNLVF